MSAFLCSSVGEVEYIPDGIWCSSIEDGWITMGFYRQCVYMMVLIRILLNLDNATFGGNWIIRMYMDVNKSNYSPKGLNIPVRYVALFSLQLVVIQPFPFDPFTATNNNNHRYIYIYIKAFTYSLSMTTTSTFRERWQGDATSLYISCMMTANANGAIG